MNRRPVVAAFTEVHEITPQVKRVYAVPIGWMFELLPKPGTEGADGGAVIPKRERRDITLNTKVVEEPLDQRVGHVVAG